MDESNKIQQIQDHFKKLSAHFDGKLRYGEWLFHHTYFRIGGPATVLAAPTSLNDLKTLSRGIKETKIPVFFIGAGSNLLVSDDGFNGLVIKTTSLNLEMEEAGDEEADQESNSKKKSEEKDSVILKTGSSIAISSLIRRTIQKGWSGIELLSGVPGTVGGAVAMNAGTHLGETKDCLSEVEAFSMETAELEKFKQSDLKFSYRENHFLENIFSILLSPTRPS